MAHTQEIKGCLQHADVSLDPHQQHLTGQAGTWLISKPTQQG